MSSRVRRGRAIRGILLLDKPSGITSNGALQRVKRLFNANKAGHTGSLDPLATGVLPICLGEATKFSQYLLDANKGYVSTFTLGVRTDSGDCDGNVLATEDASAVTVEQIARAIDGFRGAIQQIPPMYSALKQNGQPLYKLARKGIEIERTPRSVDIFEYQLVNFKPGVTAQLEVRVLCSKGTYIRSLAEDLGSILGCGAHVSSLRRYVAGAFHQSASLSLPDLEQLLEQSGLSACDKALLPVDAAIADRVAIEINEIDSVSLQQGRRVLLSQGFRPDQEADIVRVFRADQTFLGIGKVTEDGFLVPLRLISAPLLR